MDEVMDRIKRIKKCLANQDEEVASIKDRKVKPQSKKPKDKNNTKNKIQNKSAATPPRNQKTFTEVKSISELDDDDSSEVDSLDINEIKEMHQRLQSHLVNLTKIIIKNQSLKSISQEINPDMKKSSIQLSTSKIQQPEEEIVRRKKSHKKKSENVPKIDNDSLPIDDSIPFPVDFTNQKVYSTSSNSSFLLHENDFSDYYHKNHASTFNVESFLKGPATHSILKKSMHSNDMNYDYDSKSDLRASDLNSVNSIIEKAKKNRSSKKDRFSSDDDRIPGEILVISSENNEIFSANSNDSDILTIPFVPEKFNNNNEIDDNSDLIAISISSNYESNRENINDINDINNISDVNDIDDINSVEITDELKARYLDQNENTNIKRFSAIESPILKGEKEYEYRDFDVNLYEIGSDEGYQVSLEDY